MKLNSVAGIVFYVNDLEKTSKFYKSLGFTTVEQDSDHLLIRLNWFWLNFQPASKEEKREFQKEANAKTKGAGLYIHIKVDNVDDFYKDMLKKRLAPSSEPRDWPWGNREFVIRDPDGYKLVFFQKLK